MKQIVPNLWFDDNALEAAEFYCGVFPDSKITNITRYTSVGKEIHGHNEGEVLTVDFRLMGHNKFIGINGGSQFKFNPSVSFMVECKDQEEIDKYWDALSADPASEQCGWLSDKYGLSWQIVPENLDEMLRNGTQKQAESVMGAFLQMKKLDVAELENVYNKAK